eukprot:6295071-Prymnesium_polylepis.2
MGQVSRAARGRSQTPHHTPTHRSCRPAMDRGRHKRAAWTHCCRGPAPTGRCRRHLSRHCTMSHLQRLRAAAAAAPNMLGRQASRSLPPELRAESHPSSLHR